MSRQAEVPATELLAPLERGCRALELAFTDYQYQRLAVFVNLLHKWNKAYNLTAIRDPLQMVPRHILDSLSVAPHLSGERIVDVGTGGGLPGIPLAIAFPERQFTLLDSNGKKTRFLFQVKQELMLDNVTIVHSRVESYQPEKAFDGVISRAFASLLDMTEGCKHLLEPQGKFFAMKGVFPQSELSEVEKHYIVVASHQLAVPGLEGERCLLVMRSREEP
jgi:16S rRNA (guanine527-N7)-methyltransferase